jgi:hypothetical protein
MISWATSISMDHLSVTVKLTEIRIAHGIMAFGNDLLPEPPAIAILTILFRQREVRPVMFYQIFDRDRQHFEL